MIYKSSTNRFLMGIIVYRWSTIINLPADVWLGENSTNALPINLPIDFWSECLKETCFLVPAIRPNSSRFVLIRPISSRFVLIRPDSFQKVLQEIVQPPQDKCWPPGQIWTPRQIFDSFAFLPPPPMHPPKSKTNTNFKFRWKFGSVFIEYLAF